MTLIGVFLSVWAVNLPRFVIARACFWTRLLRSSKPGGYFPRLTSFLPNVPSLFLVGDRRNMLSLAFTTTIMLIVPHNSGNRCN